MLIVFVVEWLCVYKEMGFYVIFVIVCNMNIYFGNVGLIIVNIVKILMVWFDKYDVLYDEFYVGKFWGGKGGFYVDDKVI